MGILRAHTGAIGLNRMDFTLVAGVIVTRLLLKISYYKCASHTKINNICMCKAANAMYQMMRNM